MAARLPQGPGGSRVRSCYLPGSRLRLPPAAFVAFPPTRFQSSGYSGTAWAQRTPGGTDSEQSGSCTRPVTGLAIVRPSFRRSAGPPVSLSPLVGYPTLSTGQLRTRPQAMGSPVAAEGTRTPFRRTSPRGFYPPRTLSASPNIWPLLPQGWSAVESQAMPARAALSAAPARISPGMRLPRLSP